MAISIDEQGTVRLGEVFVTSFSAFHRHAVVFIILSAIGHIPSFLSKLEVAHYPGFFSLCFWGFEGLSVLAFACMIIGYGAIVHGVIQNLAGRRVSITEAVTVAVRRLAPLAGISIVAAVLINLVTQLPDLPDFQDRLDGVYMLFIAVWMQWLVTGLYFLVAPIFIAEQPDVGTALSRCRFLTKGHRRPVFGAIFLVSILDLAIFILWRAGTAPLVPIGSGWGVLVIHDAVTGAVWVVLGAFNAVLAAVFYDRLRSIKGGMDIVKVFD